MNSIIRIENVTAIVLEMILSNCKVIEYNEIKNNNGMYNVILTEKEHSKYLKYLRNN